MNNEKNDDSLRQENMDLHAWQAWAMDLYALVKDLSKSEMYISDDLDLRLERTIKYGETKLMTNPPIEEQSDESRKI